MTVRYLAPDTDAYVASVQRHAPEFEEETGLQLDVRIIPSDLYYSNRIEHLLDRDDGADVYMSGPVLVWEHLARGFVEPLDDFFERAGAEYDPGDFIEQLIFCNRWSGRFGEPLGTGPLLEIPVNCESYNLAYVPEILERYNLDPPETWEEYFRVARAIVERSDDRVRGFAQRGTDAWHTIYTGFATQFWSYGACDFEQQRCALASNVSVDATAQFLSALRSAGPSDWMDQRWYELALDFANGSYGLIVDSDHYVAYYENPAQSSFVGKIAYALPPVGPTGARRPNLWTWSMVMNARSRNKAEAWQFMQWATSKKFLFQSALEGNMNPTRTSTWDDERFRDLTDPWGSFYDVARTLIEREASVLVTPAPNYLAIARRWVAALREAYVGDVDLGDALTAAAARIDELVSSAEPV